MIGITFHDEQENDLCLVDGEEHKRAYDYLKKMDAEALLENWFNSHVMELGYTEQSGLRPHRLVCAVIYIEPLGNTVEEIIGET